MKKAGSDRTAKPVRTVDGYLKSLPPEVRATLEDLRRTIRVAAPKADELISYQMPAFKYHGFLVFFAAFKNHCSFFVGSKSIMKKFRRELKPYEASGGTIRFSTENPLPPALVKRIVKARIEENESRLKRKSKKSGSRSA